MTEGQTICHHWEHTNSQGVAIFMEQFHRLLKEDKQFRDAVNGLKGSGWLSLQVTDEHTKVEETNYSFKQNYKNHIASPKWKAIRANVIAIRGSKCEECGSTSRLHVHHLHYRTFGDELPEDLKVLCKNCHDKKHQ